MSDNVFYNGYDKSKRYQFVRALSGRAPQSQEFNAIQSHYLELVRSICSDVLKLKDGTVLSGCDAPGSTASTTLAIPEGYLYLGGLVHKVEAQTLTLATGENSVYAKLTKSIVTSASDATLLDPAIGKQNYGKPGADREQQTVTWSLTSAANTDTVSYTEVFRYTVADGKGLRKKDAWRNESDLVNDAIARRSRVSEGNYLIGGLSVSVRESATDATKLVVQIDAGSAVVDGREVVRTDLRELVINKALTTAAGSFTLAAVDPSGVCTVTNLPESAGVKVPMAAVPAITLNLQADVEYSHTAETDWTLSVLGNTNLVAVISVKTSENTTVDPSNYTYSGGNTLHLNNALDAGTYTVRVAYRSTVSLASNKYTVNAAASRVTLGAALMTDLHTSPALEIDYTYYLPRVDLLQLHQLDDGKLEILEGTPGLDPLAPSPNSSTLVLGEIHVQAGNPGSYTISPGPDVSSASTYVLATKPTVVTQRELREALRRLDKLEQANASQELNYLAVRYANSQLSGAFSDAFISNRKYETRDNLANLQVDVAQGILRLPEVAQELSLTSSPAGNTQPQKTTSYLTLPYAEVARTPVATATGVLALNSENYFAEAPFAVSYLNEELFLDTTGTHAGTAAQTIFDAKTLRGVWGEVADGAVKNVAAIKSAQEGTTYYSLPKQVQVKAYAFPAGATSVTARVNGRLCRMVRQDSTFTPGISFVGKAVWDFVTAGAGNPNVGDTMSVTIDGATVTSAAATSGSTKGSLLDDFVAKVNLAGSALKLKGFTAARIGSTGLRIVAADADLEREFTFSYAMPAAMGANPLVESGTMQVNASRGFEATVEVPAGIPMGNQQIELRATVSGQDYAAYAPFFVRGPVERIGSQPAFARVLGTTPAAAAQIILAEESAILGLGLYFTKADATKPLEVQVREVINGLPGDRVLASKVLHHADVVGSLNDATTVATETSPKEFKLLFTDPVFTTPGTPVALVLSTGSQSGWELEVAKQGSNAVNPYASGSFYTGTPGGWQEKPDTDLRFKVYAANPTGTDVELVFDELATPSFTGATAILLRSSQRKPLGSSIQWLYAIPAANGQYGDWKVLSEGIRTELASAEDRGIATKVKLKLKLTGSKDALPWVNLGSLRVIGLLRQTAGYYHSLMVPYASVYNQVNLELEVKDLAQVGDLAPAAWSSNALDGGSWIAVPVDTSYTPQAVPGGYVRRRYKLTDGGLDADLKNFWIQLKVDVGATAAVKTGPQIRNLITWVS